MCSHALSTAAPPSRSQKSTMSGRGLVGRERIRREEKGRSDGNPPSRHLWVGNLPHGMTERELSDRFARFGVLESVAYQPGRSYAFVNFKHEEDAFVAIDSLDGQPVAGNPLRIEFAKADKSSVPRSEDHFRHNEPHFTSRPSPSFQKDYRPPYECSVYYDSYKSKMGDAVAEPSKVLWIGFPAQLNVDEAMLRKAFIPFGEIEKITTFPSRSYAFARFKNIISACRAKETLQGKLFGNPRVLISFAKSDPSSSNSERMSSRTTLSPSSLYIDQLSSGDYLHDRKYGTMTGETDYDDLQVYRLDKKGMLHGDIDNRYERQRLGENRSEHGLQQDMYEKHASSRDRDPSFLDISQSHFMKSSKQPCDENAYFHNVAKRLKTSSFSAETDLPEYRLSDLEQERLDFPKVISDSLSHASYSESFVEAGQLGYKQLSSGSVSTALFHGERRLHDDFRVESHPLPSMAVEMKRCNPEPGQSSLKDWKWEGLIAKGGNPVCRARCFPVGKAMDMMLPDFLDCTARTSLDMLAKHYYQASNAWVVFFVPESDAEMGFYKEFMHYLQEKGRAAVSKLDETTTLFLVPPSDFSEKVLKVPGRLSISGVVLRLDYPEPCHLPVPQPNVSKQPNLLGYHGGTLYPKLSEVTNLPDVGNRDFSNPSASFFTQTHAIGKAAESKHLPSPPFGSNQPPVPPTTTDSSIHYAADRHHAMMPEQVTGRGASDGAAGPPQHTQIRPPTQGAKPPILLSNLQPEQLAQLASSIPRHQRQLGQTPSITTLLEHSMAPPGFSDYQFSQKQQIQPQHISEGPATTHHMVQSGHQAAASGMQQVQTNGAHEDAEADPQKRLQATLQLATALLQQIQQKKDT